MNWKIFFTKTAQKQLLSLDIQIQKKIQKDINEKLLTNLDYYLEGLEGVLNKYYKFRVGDYRLICEKQIDKLVIVIIKLKHRKEIYKS